MKNPNMFAVPGGIKEKIKPVESKLKEQRYAEITNKDMENIREARAELKALEDEIIASTATPEEKDSMVKSLVETRRKIGVIIDIIDEKGGPAIISVDEPATSQRAQEVMGTRIVQDIIELLKQRLADEGHSVSDVETFLTSEKVNRLQSLYEHGEVVLREDVVDKLATEFEEKKAA